MGHSRGSDSRLRPRRRAVALAAALVLLAGACASSDEPEVAAGGGSADADTTAATTTTEHSHGGDDGHHHGGDACDVAANPVGYYDDAELAGTIGAEYDPSEHEHGHDQGPEGEGEGEGEDPDEPNDMSGGMGEAAAAQLVQRLTELPQDEYEQWLQSLDPQRDVAAPDDTGAGGHLGPQSWTHITDEDVCTTLFDELETAREVALRYPKASDAVADGYRLVAPYLPGIASHWMKFNIVDGEFDVTQPEMLLFDGNTEDANIVGLSYFITHDGDTEPAVGFTGGNDHYHRHVGLCVSRESGVIGDSTTTDEECEAAGGFKNNSSSGWMSHAWVVPGCESPWGVFSAQNPILDMPLVQSSGQGEPCSGSAATARWDLSPAED